MKAFGIFSGCVIVVALLFIGAAGAATINDNRARAVSNMNAKKAASPAASRAVLTPAALRKTLDSNVARQTATAEVNENTVSNVAAENDYVTRAELNAAISLINNYINQQVGEIDVRADRNLDAANRHTDEAFQQAMTEIRTALESMN